MRTRRIATAVATALKTRVAAALTDGVLTGFALGSGLVLVSVGVGMIYEPAGLIVGGALLATAAALHARSAA